MASAKSQREFLAVLMESPIYFIAPLLRRLEVPNFFSQRSIHYRLCAYGQHLLSRKSNPKLRESEECMNH